MSSADPERPRSLKRWTLERVRFLLAHLEDFVDDDLHELRERARAFVPAGDLENVSDLGAGAPGDPALPAAIFTKLAAFFNGGVLLQRGLMAEDTNWWVTDLFWRGSAFHLELADQIRGNSVLSELTPLQVSRAPATLVLNKMKLSFLSPSHEANAYLLRPVPAVAFVLISELASPFARDHVERAHKLINKCFLF